MKVCVFGAGAVGSHLAARLGNSSAVQLSVVARGSRLEEILSSGIRVESGEETWLSWPVASTDDPRSLPEQDVVFVTLKSADQASVAHHLRHLVGRKGHAVFVTNGIPWWWNQGSESPAPLPLVDKDCRLWNEFGVERALGCVVYSGNQFVAPGVVRHTANNRWIVGEPDDYASERVALTVSLMRDAGLGAEPSTNLRREVLAKLVLNASVNPVAALTGLPIEWLASDNSVKLLTHAVIDEIGDIAQALGHDVRAACQATRDLVVWPSGVSFDQGRRPSMLQDISVGKPVEVEALLGQICAFADLHKVSCLNSRALLALLRGVNVGLRARRPIAHASAVSASETFSVQSSLPFSVDPSFH